MGSWQTFLAVGKAWSSQHAVAWDRLHRMGPGHVPRLWKLWEYGRQVEIIFAGWPGCASSINHYKSTVGNVFPPDTWQDLMWPRACPSGIPSLTSSKERSERRPDIPTSTGHVNIIESGAGCVCGAGDTCASRATARRPVESVAAAEAGAGTATSRGEGRSSFGLRGLYIDQVNSRTDPLKKMSGIRLLFCGDSSSTKLEPARDRCWG